MSDITLVVGAGQAGLTLAQTLREKGAKGRIVLLGEEAHPPYQRPPLSKKFLAGEIAEDRLFLKPSAFYEKFAIDLRLGVRVDALDLARGQVEHAGGALAFDRLVIATGTRPRGLPVQGMALPGVHMLRGIPDVERVRPLIARKGRLVIVGGGYIGLEVAAVARALGLEVVVLEAAERVMARVVAPSVSRFFEDLHRANGVELHVGASLAAIEKTPLGLVAVTAAGNHFQADVILVAIGAVPNAELAADAGLPVDDGVVVGADTRTIRPNVHAIGDCTRFPSALYGRAVRLESVQNAVDQAKAAAAAILGESVAYDPVPWFWSDQFDVKLQITGLSQGHDRAILRGDVAGRAFSVFYLRGGRLLAVDSINRPRDHMLARRFVGQVVTGAPESLGDGETPWETSFASL